ncbi:IS66 family insertion sequence element accessory protein TnpB [Rhodopirellula europaea]|uniref:IS66 family insertion sequence element accessory protein TnpB n=1 Tax=Rhodopirellula europaea TaxID=1263866 RepID=UPI003D2D74EE|tara:strand:+ start:24570 stop:25319 length:750 start_codon:yes stop_codon:yes gene_type:complete
MISVATTSRIFVFTSPTDMRKSFNGFSGTVAEHFDVELLSGHLLLFFNRRREGVKVLAWDRDGLAIWYKRLEAGMFELSALGDAKASLEIDHVNLHVATGPILSPLIRQTRTEEDFLENIDGLVCTDVAASWRFVTDNLNTHASEPLVRYVATQCGIGIDLGVKGRHGILKSLPSRREFLRDQSHQIHFVYTPKHCNWLNQIEIWFGTLFPQALHAWEVQQWPSLPRSLKTNAAPSRWMGPLYSLHQTM